MLKRDIVQENETSKIKHKCLGQKEVVFGYRNRPSGRFSVSKRRRKEYHYVIEVVLLKRKGIVVTITNF